MAVEVAFGRSMQPFLTKPQLHEFAVKLEYLAEGSPDCPLIRLFDFTSEEARQLWAAVLELAEGTVQQVEVHRLPFVHTIGDCRLTLANSAADVAVIRLGSLADFRCAFSVGTWKNVAGLIEPFAKAIEGFQWLAGVPGEAALLLSASGWW